MEFVTLFLVALVAPALIATAIDGWRGYKLQQDTFEVVLFAYWIGLVVVGAMAGLFR